MANNYSYGKGMTAQRKPIPPVPPPKKAWYIKWSYIMMTFTVHVYYSKHEVSDIEHFDVHYNYSYGKGMPAQRKPIPPVPPPKKAR